MTNRSRRDFLKLAAGSTGFLAAYAGFPPAIRKALAIPAATRSGTIEDVEHIVILMQENRSFDHYFGGLRGVRGFNDPRPHLLPNSRPVWQQPPASVYTSKYHARGLSPSADQVLPFYIDPDRTTDHIPGTNHGWSSGHLAWAGGWWDQWVNQKQDTLTMGYLKRQDLLYHYALADAFTLCDAYFSSAHADTAPNRIYLWSGTIDTCNRLGHKPNGPGLSERSHRNGYTWTTYPERLEANGVSWQVYQGGSGIPGTPTDNFSDNSLEFFANYQAAEGASGALVEKGASRHTLAELRNDALSGQLPQVCWIVAPQKYSEHPSASSTDGAEYINMVLKALTANPEVWSKTVFFINYDENDGLFDHVVPPMPPIRSQSNDQGMVSYSLLSHLSDEILDLDRYPQEISPLIPGADPGGLQPVGLGARTPMLVVSPWSKGGWVCSEVFDHTSVLRFLEARFGITESNISPWRRSICGNLTAAFDFSAQPDPRTISFAVPPAPASQGQPIQVPEPQTMPQQEPGSRPARPLAYAFTVNSQLSQDQTSLSLKFDNTGQNGAAFYVYDRRHSSQAPRRYAVAAQDSLSDQWNISATEGYDLAVYGPNGYLSEFKGVPSESPALEAELSSDPSARLVHLDLRYSGKAPCQIHLDNAYDTNPAQNRLLQDGKPVRMSWALHPDHGWFDLSLSAIATANGSQTFRRFAGHIETGRPSLSDPGPVKA